MKRTNAAFLWGGLLIAAGIGLLLQNLGLADLGWLWDAFWTLLFTVGGLAFLAVFLRDNENWWALIPGFTLLGLGGLLGLSLVSDSLAGRIGAPLFLGSIGLGFWVIYAVRRDQWWAVIPGGVLFSVAAFVFMEPLLPEPASISVMFFGMALTFLLVALLPTPQGRMTWAFIPSGILALIGLFMALSGFSTQFLTLAAVVGPLALIVAGGYLLYRNAIARK